MSGPGIGLHLGYKILFICSDFSWLLLLFVLCFGSFLAIFSMFISV